VTNLRSRTEVKVLSDVLGALLALLEQPLRIRPIGLSDSMMTWLCE
jgi:hypothetical protein